MCRVRPSATLSVAPILSRGNLGIGVLVRSDSSAPPFAVHPAFALFSARSYVHSRDSTNEKRHVCTFSSRLLVWCFEDWTLLAKRNFLHLERRPKAKQRCAACVSTTTDMVHHADTVKMHILRGAIFRFMSPGVREFAILLGSGLASKESPVFQDWTSLAYIARTYTRTGTQNPSPVLPLTKYGSIHPPYKRALIAGYHPDATSGGETATYYFHIHMPVLLY